jgi:Immunity protein 49
MEYIERQTPDLEFVRACAGDWFESLTRILSKDLSNPSLWGILHSDALCYAGYLSALEPNSPDICKYLKLSAQAVAALFVSAAAEPGYIDVPIGDGSLIHIPAIEPSSRTHAVKWCNGFFVAIISCDTGSLDRLCTVPISLTQLSSTRSSKFFYLFAEALQSFYLGKREAYSLLAEAMRLATPEDVYEGSWLYNSSITIPWMNLLNCVMHSDQERFSAVLQEALELHKKFWTKDEDSLLHSESYLALGLIAICRLAHEQGMIVDGDSDYLPLRLVAGECAQINKDRK